ncbi:MAG TPA: hypothetical protein PKA81_12760 [Clostridia bacterium]|nr:hypothetical protein [Clostridia bacterium]
MRKLLSLALSLMMVAFVFTGCAKAKDAAQGVAEQAVESAEKSEEAEAGAAEEAQQSAPDGGTASAFYSAYMEAKSDVLTRLMDGIGNNPDTMMSAFSFLGISMSDLYLLPALYFGLGESSVATALAMMGAKDVTYNEQGNQYTVAYKNSEDKESSLTGTYDKGKSLVAVGSTNGKEDVFAETYRTAFGYVGQFYFIAEDGTATLYQVSISGTDGVFGVLTGVDRPAALTGSEAADFPKAAKEWYAITGNTITGMTAEGKSVNFAYVPSENEG